MCLKFRRMNLRITRRSNTAGLDDFLRYMWVMWPQFTGEFLSKYFKTSFRLFCKEINFSFKISHRFDENSLPSFPGRYAQFQAFGKLVQACNESIFISRLTIRIEMLWLKNWHQSDKWSRYWALPKTWKSWQRPWFEKNAFQLSDLAYLITEYGNKSFDGNILLVFDSFRDRWSNAEYTSHVHFIFGCVCWVH